MITQEEVESLQESWAQAVVRLGATTSQEEAHAQATQLVREHYVLDGEPLLFCPTKAAEQQFRTTLEAAVSYFVGNNTNHDEDQGFALEPWASVRFQNAGIICRSDTALAMGNYFFGRADGSELKAEFSFVYMKDSQGSLKIQLHHSAVPYSP